jgi:hypothetical protein
MDGAAGHREFELGNEDMFFSKKKIIHWLERLWFGNLDEQLTVKYVAGIRNGKAVVRTAAMTRREWRKCRRAGKPISVEEYYTKFGITAAEDQVETMLNDLNERVM